MALRAGLTKNVLRGPTVQRLGHGLYVAAGSDPGLLEHAAAIMLAMPSDAVVTGATALHLYGVRVGNPCPIEVVTATGAQTRRPGVRLTRASALPPNRRRMTTPVAAWLSACSKLDLIDAVTAADWIAHSGLAPLSAIREAAASASGRGCRLARRAAGLARENVESPRETQLRLMVVLAGLPTPRCNITLGNESFIIGRVDMRFGEFLVILEYDGDQHRSDRDQWNLDLDRNESFADCGYLTLRVSSARMRRPRDLVRRLHRLLVERGYSGPAPVFSAEWSALFEGTSRV